MSINFEYNNRQIIPRFHPFRIAYYLGEIGNDQVKIKGINVKDIDIALYKKKESEWINRKNLLTAIDFVGTALILNDLDNKNVHIAAELILKNKKTLSKLAIEIAESYLGIKNKSIECQFDIPKKKDLSLFYNKISLLKSYVQKYPINPIPWVDLAYFYLILGQFNKAEHCIKIALSINSENRFILRSASRLYLHLGQPDLSLYILRNSDLIQRDPWLIASEVSIAEAFELKPKYIKCGKNLIRYGNNSSKNMAELLGTLATLEFTNGAIKKSKNLLKDALIDPNENTLAQANWLSSKIGAFLDLKQYTVPCLYEANSWSHYLNGEFKKSLENAKKWQYFQPFSSRASIFSSYIASVCTQNDNEAINLIKIALVSTPNDPLLLNNYAFSLANLNKAKEAKSIIDTINLDYLSPQKKATILATKGLISFRLKKIDEGRNLYKKAIDIFKRIENKNALALAYLFFGREESIVKSKDRDKYLGYANSLANKYNIVEINIYLKSIYKKFKISKDTNT